MIPTPSSGTARTLGNRTVFKRLGYLAELLDAR
jgi:hypothetical protein